MTTYGAFVVLAASALIASSGLAQRASFRPDEQKCPSGSVPDMPGFQPGVTPAGERFDLSYSTRSNGTIEVELKSKSSGGGLLFIGVEHVSSPDLKMFEYLESILFRTKPSEAFVEVDDVSYLATLPADKDSVIRTRGEPSYLGFIARREGVPVFPLEPRRDDLAKILQRRFPADDVALAFVLRDVQIARDRRRLYGEALEAQASRALDEQDELLKRAGKTFAIRNILHLTLTVDRHWRGLDWRQVPAEWFNPLLTAKQTGSKFINPIFADEMAVRDRHALRLLLGRVALGQRVVALAGRSHAETHLQTLTCLIAGKTNDRLIHGR